MQCFGEGIVFFGEGTPVKDPELLHSLAFYYDLNRFYRQHRFRNHQQAAKLQRNLGPPTNVLHIANVPEGYTHVDIKVLSLVGPTGLHPTDIANYIL